MYKRDMFFSEEKGGKADCEDGKKGGWGKDLEVKREGKEMWSDWKNEWIIN